MMKDAFSEARKKIASAISWGEAMRPSGVSSQRAPRSSSLRLASISVLVAPGATQFTRIPTGPSSFAKDFVNPIIAALEAEYTTSQDAPVMPHMEEILIMEPACLKSIPGRAARVQ